MSNLLSNFVSKVQTKHWQNLQRRTQKLDVAERETLLEYLEDHLVTPSPATTGSGGYRDNNDDGNHEDNPAPQDESETANENDDNDDDDDEFAEEDYELLQRDLDKAHLRLEELQSKHDFLKTRLETYQSKIQAAEDALVSSATSLAPERLQAMTAKIDSYKQALQPVHATYQSLTVELESHQTKINSMQDRQLELKLKTQECQVVLQELCYGMEQAATTPTDQEILAQIVEPNNDNEQDSPSSFQDEHASKDEDVENAKADGDDNEEDDTNPEEDDIELVETANTKIGSLSIPAGTHAETN